LFCFCRGKVSKEFAPAFAQHGKVIDNSSVWRMDPEIKLIVPEINAEVINSNDRIIANPNCSTIQLVMVLAPLHKKIFNKQGCFINLPVGKRKWYSGD